VALDEFDRRGDGCNGVGLTLLAGFFAESLGPALSAKNTCTVGRPFVESWSPKALGEGALRCGPKLRRQRALMLSAKSACAESRAFGSQRSAWLTVKGRFPVVLPTSCWAFIA
jgi:hypothetical protein